MKKISFIVGAGILLSIFSARNSAFAANLNCGDPRSANENCIIKFESMEFESLLLSSIKKHYPDLISKSAKHITVGQAREVEEIFISNENPFDLNIPLNKPISINGIQYFDNIKRLAIDSLPIYDLSPIGETQAMRDTTVERINISRMLILENIELNKYGVFKNPLIGIYGKTDTFNNVKEDFIDEEIAQYGFKPTRLISTDEKGNPKPKGGYLKSITPEYTIPPKRILEIEDSSAIYLANTHEENFVREQNLSDFTSQIYFFGFTTKKRFSENQPRKADENRRNKTSTGHQITKHRFSKRTFFMQYWQHSRFRYFSQFRRLEKSQNNNF